MESQAVAAGKFARWYDRQAFARWNLMNLSGRFVKAYKELDPLAVTGFEGTGGFGDDINNIISINTFYSPYPSIGDDILRSIADRSLIRANWMGYSKNRRRPVRRSLAHGDERDGQHLVLDVERRRQLPWLSDADA